MLFAIGSYAVAGPRDGPGKVPDSKKFDARLNGFQETPSISSTGFGNFEAELVNPTKLHYVFTYGGLEGGTSLFAHVHFGQRERGRRRLVLPLWRQHQADRRARMSRARSKAT